MLSPKLFPPTTFVVSRQIAKDRLSSGGGEDKRTPIFTPTSFDIYCFILTGSCLFMKITTHIIIKPTTDIANITIGFYGFRTTIQMRPSNTGRTERFTGIMTTTRTASVEKRIMIDMQRSLQ